MQALYKGPAYHTLIVFGGNHTTPTASLQPPKKFIKDGLNPTCVLHCEEGIIYPLQATTLCLAGTDLCGVLDNRPSLIFSCADVEE